MSNRFPVLQSTRGVRFGVLIVAVLAVASLSACKKKAETAAMTAAAEKIVIGEVGSMTGDQATFGQSTHNGIELAFKEITAAGGVKGKPLELISMDDQGKPAEAASAVTKLITLNGVTAILGEVASSISLAMAPVAQNYKVPMISPSSTNPKVTQAGDYVFRVCFIDPFQGTVMAKFAADSLKAKKIAILREITSDYSIGLANYFVETFKKLGGAIVIDQSYGSQDVDFKSQLTAIRGTNPDAIFVPGYYTHVGLIAKQARELGIKVPLLGGDGWDSPKLKEIGGTAIDGSYFANHYTVEDKSEVVQKFIANYKAAYKAVPDGLAAMGYDAAKVLADAMNRSATLDKAAIRDSIARTQNHPGVTGKISIDADRNTIKPAVVIRVDKGEFRYQTTINP